ncbi:GYDIA family GHMP kinase [Robertkochia flava]|uniref:GYDIA family GHMP kinase n=1 Tax=Robertkochia flava TaxID=3447986 RepID=UPI001CCF96B1|nr:GYDIA family GHMP kinase [Robertkochia marina]
MGEGKSTYYSHGKVLLSGEYLILDGATGLALPTKKGQRLEVSTRSGGMLHFTSYEPNGKAWFETSIHLGAFLNEVGTEAMDPERIIAAGDKGPVTGTLLKILQSIHTQNPSLLEDTGGLSLSSFLEFERDWGLGSSSTFIHNLALWSKTDPYRLLAESLGGSGYDIACAGSDAPLFYNRTASRPLANKVNFNPNFKEHLYFIHLNRKQNSREGIRRYRSLKQRPEQEIQKAGSLSRDFATSQTLELFSSLMAEHEELISSLLGIPSVQEELFPDFDGQLKSLGAWGGDFILAATRNNPEPYFRSKGYHTIIPFEKMIL